VNTREAVQALLEVEAQVKALDTKRSELRAVLDDHLRGVWETEGIASTLKAPGLGTVLLAGCDSTVTEITDPDAYTRWAQENHPDLVRTAPLVETSLLTALTKGGVVDPDGRLVTGDGEVVPGVEVRPRRPYLTVKLDREARARAVAALEGVPVVVPA
jgi:hypothetical protein